MTRIEKLVLSCGALAATVQPGRPALAADASTRLDVQLGEPVAAAISAPGEKRWGFHQFPTLMQLPDGRIGLGYSHNADAIETYGTTSPFLVSADGGKTWNVVKDDPIAAVKPHASITPVGDGAFLCVPPTKPLDLGAAGITMPEPSGAIEPHKNYKFLLYRFDACPRPVQDHLRELPAWRWTRESGAWKAETVAYDTRGLVVFKRQDGPEAKLLPRAWFEHPAVQLGDELFYADYRTKYEGGDGKIAPNWTTVCMVSSDKGRTWERRGLIAADPSGKRMMAEPMIAPTSDGALACVIRGEPGPMVISFSRDRGRTWTPIEPLHEFGVFPGLILLENKVLVCSFGRPGVHLKFSADGTGRSWSAPTLLNPGNAKDSMKDTCGYTSLLAVGPDEFLIAYSDFNHKDAQNRQHKAILVRRVKVTPGTK